MEQRAAETTDHRGGENRPIGRGETDERDAESAEKRSQRDKPGQGNLVGVIAEKRLKHRGKQHVREDQRSRLLVRKPVVRYEVRQKRGDRALRPIDAGVSQREIVDGFVHGFHKHPSSRRKEAVLFACIL